MFASSASPQGSAVQLHYIHMRGIPFQASGEDIVKVKVKITNTPMKPVVLMKLRTAGHDLTFVPLLQFFSPLVVSKILIECGRDGRPTGEADVYFSCHQDAMAAMSRDRQHIGETGKETLTAGDLVFTCGLINSVFTFSVYFLGERYIELFLNSVPYSNWRWGTMDSIQSLKL